MKTIIYILSILAISNCSCRQRSDWRQKYFDQEKSKIVTIKKGFRYDSGKGIYILIRTDSSFQTFNEKGQKISDDNQTFYLYDAAGNLILEEYCLRTCDMTGKKKYYYDKSNKLYKIAIVFFKDTIEQLIQTNYYNDKGLLKETVFGHDSLAKTENYIYDDFDKLICQTTREYNSNIQNWLEYVDSFYYNDKNKLTIKHHKQINEDLLAITKFSYDNNGLLISELDTAISSIPSNKYPDKSCSYSVYYNKTDYKYNQDNKLIEEIRYQPDYKTPDIKFTYEYR